MKKKHSILLALLSLAFLCATSPVFAQKKATATVSSTITDESGNPVENAEIFSGAAYVKTDAEGKFTLKIEPGSRIIVEAKGFEIRTLAQGEASNMEKIALKQVKFKFGENEKVDLAFRKAYEGDVVGFVTKVGAKDLSHYDNVIWASDALNGRTLGMLGGNNIRGVGIGVNVGDITNSGLNSGNALYIVDGLPRDIDGLRLSEVEDIVVLKDVNAAALYGSAAINGVVLITTKRGEAYKKTSNFSVNYGISTPRMLPSYLNSADYMTYYNQARVNDGLTPLWADSTIQNYRSGNPYRYPSIDYYSDEYLSPFKDYFDVMGEFSGGNDVAKFYSVFGWNSAGSLIDFGEAANARDNTFNIRGNVDLKINNWIQTSIDGVSVFGNDRYQRSTSSSQNFWQAASAVRPYEFTPLLPISLINAEDPLLIGRKRDINGEYLLGGNTNFQTNRIADTYSAGKVERISRKFSFNNRVDFDLEKLTQGLSFHTNISFDFWTRFDQTIENQYSVYEPVWSFVNGEDRITSLKQFGQDASPGTQVVGNTTFNRRFGFYGLLCYDRIFSEKHHVTGSLFGYGTSMKEQGVFQSVKQAHIGLQAGYSFDNRFLVDFSSAYVNSIKLPEGNRGGFSPTLGLAWVLSNESFLSSSENIDYLKLRLSAGSLNSDMPIGGFFYYDNNYTTSGSYGWYDGQRSRSGVVSQWLNNPDLGFAKRNEVNLGVEGLFFNKFLGVEANVFYDVYSDLVIRRTASYPSFYTTFIPYENYNADSYKGAELGLSVNKEMGDWTVWVKANMLYISSERTKVDEFYVNDYQYRKGHPVDATFGLEALGLFQDQAEIDASPKQLFGSVKPGDIKYKDQNADGFVDSNDEVEIRRYQAPVSGGLQIKISYKSLTLYALGEGRSGADSFKESSYYWIDGNDKYSEIVMGAWTADTKATANYPRLSAQTNSNNFRRSTYWLYDDSYFSINKVQLTWNMPEKLASLLLMKKLDLFVNASNIHQFAKNREIRDLRVGNEPYSRTFSIGIKTNF